MEKPRRQSSSYSLNVRHENALGRPRAFFDIHSIQKNQLLIDPVSDPFGFEVVVRGSLRKRNAQIAASHLFGQVQLQ